MQVVLFVVAAVALAVPQSPDSSAETLRFTSDVGPESYAYEYETSNSIKANQAGQLKQVGTEQAINVQGQFSYNAPDGTPIQLSYVADENGYQPQVSIFFCIFLVNFSRNFQFFFSSEKLE